MLLGTEMLELTPATGFSAVFVVVQLLLGALFVIVPLGLLIYVVVLFRRLTAAVQGIERHLARSADTGEPPPAS